MIKLPQGIRADLKVYFISDKTGLDASLNIKNLKAFPEEFSATYTNASKYLPGEGIDDWRLMTDEEIKAYLKKEKEENGE